MNTRTASLLTALLFLATPLALVPTVSAQAVPDCTPPSDRDADPVWETLCEFATGAPPTGLGGTLMGTDSDLDDREDLVKVELPNPAGGTIDVFVQVDLLYSPASANSNTDYAGIAASVDDGALDVPVEAMLYDPTGTYRGTTSTLSSHDEIQFRLTNHYGVPRSQVGQVEGYLGLYDFDASHPDGYGSCYVCFQETTNRFGVRAGPSTFAAHNGAPETVGLLQANALGTSTITVPVPSQNTIASYPGFALDLDAISPDDSTEIEDSILERKTGAGAYVDATPTSVLVSQRIVNSESKDLDYPDGEAVHLRFFHVKYNGDRGQPTDVTGPYTKYSNLDDDPSTDYQEITCIGQPTNPINPNAYCADWDGDGILNVNDANPASPDVFITASFTSGDANADRTYDSSVETPSIPPLSYTCSGNTKRIEVQVSKNGGTTWEAHEGFAGAAGVNAIESTCNASSSAPLGNDRPLKTSDLVDKDWKIRLAGINARDTPFYSQQLQINVLANSQPVGVADVLCRSVATPDPCSSNQHNLPEVKFAWRWTPDSASPGGVGANDPGQQISSILVTDWLDRDDSGTAIRNDDDRIAMTKQPDGTWEVEEFYFPGTVDFADFLVTDSGGASTTYRVNLAVQVQAPTAVYDGAALDTVDDGVLMTSFVQITDSNVGVLAPSVGLFDTHEADIYYYVDTGSGAPTSDAQFTKSDMFLNECLQPYSETPNALVLELQTCAMFRVDDLSYGADSLDPFGYFPVIMSEWQGEVVVPASSTVYYYFEAFDADGGLKRIFDAGNDYFDLEVPDAAEAPPGPTDPQDYFIGDCNLVADLVLRATTGEPAPGCDEIEPEDYTSLLDGVTPGDDVDYRNTDGDGEFDESNGQIDYVEMYVASYDFNENGRPSVRWYRTNGVTPVTAEELRLTAGDNPDTDVTELLLLVIDGQGVNPQVAGVRPVPADTVARETGYFYYCAYLDGSSIRVGEGRTEAEACSANELPPVDDSTVDTVLTTLCDADVDPACDPGGYVSGLPAELTEQLCDEGVPLPDCGGEDPDPVAILCDVSPAAVGPCAVPDPCADTDPSNDPAGGCPTPDPCDDEDPANDPAEGCGCGDDPQCIAESIPDMVLAELCDMESDLPFCEGAGDPDPVGLVCGLAPMAPPCGGGSPLDFPSCGTPKPEGEPVRICRSESDNHLVTGNTNEFTGNEGGLVLEIGSNMRVKL